MFDFRLKVFDTVASRLSFTKAAHELNITQPAVTKHIKEIEQQLNTQLFNRSGNKIELTASGKILRKHTQKLFLLYNDLTFELHQLSRHYKGVIRIGASTTIAQYVLPAVLADFKERFKNIRIKLQIDNTERVEQWLQQQQIDIGFIEGATKNKAFKYTRFLRDEIVLVGKTGHPLTRKGTIGVEDIKAFPLLIREAGSGTLETISFALKPYGIKLNEIETGVELGNTESIKSYLMHSNSVAFLSVHSIFRELQHNMLSVIDIRQVAIERMFYSIQAQGDQSALTQLFLNFTLRYNFR